MRKPSVRWGEQMTKFFTWIGSVCFSFVSKKSMILLYTNSLLRVLSLSLLISSSCKDRLCPWEEIGLLLKMSRNIIWTQFVKREREKAFLFLSRFLMLDSFVSYVVFYSNDTIIVYLWQMEKEMKRKTGDGFEIQTNRGNKWFLVKNYHHWQESGDCLSFLLYHWEEKQDNWRTDREGKERKSRRVTREEHYLFESFRMIGQSQWVKESEERERTWES